MRIQHVLQQHGDGCGVACLAMVAGISYDEALRIVFRRPAEAVSDRMIDDEKIIRALRRRGYKVRRMRGDFRKLRRPVIVGILWEGQVPNNNEGHFVVWCPVTRKFVDPAYPTPFNGHVYVNGWRRARSSALVISPPGA